MKNEVINYIFDKIRINLIALKKINKY